MPNNVNKNSDTSLPEDAEMTMSAGEFWLKAIFNPRFVSLELVLLPAALVLSGFAMTYLSIVEAETARALVLWFGGFCVFMATFLALASAALAQAIVATQTITPRGFGSRTNIAQATAGVVLYSFAAFLLLVVLRPA